MIAPQKHRSIDLLPPQRRSRPFGRFRPPLPRLPVPARRDDPRGIVERPPGEVVRRRDAVYRRMLVGGDALVAIAALLVVTGFEGLRAGAVLMPVLLVVTYKVVGLYDRDEGVMRRSTLAEVPRLAEMAGLFALLSWLVAGNFMTEPMGRPDVAALWLLVFGGTAVIRGLARQAARRLTPAERLAIVGDSAGIGRIRSKIEASRINAVVVETLVTTGGGQPLPHPSPEGFTGWLEDRGVERLVIAPDGVDRADELDFVRLAKAAGVRVSLLPRMIEAIGSSVEFEDVDGMTVLGLRSFGLSRSSRALKRGFDLVGAGFGVVAISPLLLAFAVLIKLDSRGPVFFRQPRVGRDGRQFGMLKFRSMVDGADAMKDALRDRNEVAGGMFKIAGDPRITRVGRLLRRSSLDELPQLLNVLRGEMSLVGPRPLIVEEDEQVKGLDRQRLELTPGMTGPWQILGPARVPLREMVSIDCLYVANWTLWRDIEILVRTVVHVVRRRGA